MSTIRLRRGVEADRLTTVPRSGEPLYATDSHKLYIGDGVTPGGIEVVGDGGGGGGGAVTSVNGRVGSVVGLAEASDLTAHTSNTSNPHSVTKAQVGLSNVPNTDFTAAVAANTAKISYTDAAKVAGIENNADVTDTANVTAAGALMDSEVTNLAQVKAFDSSDYATAAQGALADTAVQPADLPTSIDDLNPSQTGQNGKFLTTNGSTASWATIAGGGDMLASVYDPTSVVGDAFDQDNMADGTTNKNYTATEKTKLAGIETAADVTDATNVDAAGATMNTDTTLAGNGYFLDEDDMVSNSATKVPSQQSVKAYVDDAVSTIGSVSIVTKETPSGTINSINTDFVTSQPYVGGSLQVYVNGVAQGSLATESDPSAGEFAIDAPPTGANLQVSYQYADSVTGNADTLDGYHLSAIMDAIYPVGSIYIGTSTGTMPALIASIGTWVRVEGKFIVGASSSDSDFDYNDTGGAKTHTHALSAAGQAAIYATANTLYQIGSGVGFTSTARGTGLTTSSFSTSVTNSAALMGATDSGNGLPPFKAKYMWERTA